ncbi:alpha/beta hydrolase-fold protein [Flavihumibacter solisilvae]|uniref:Peptidase S9 prolyl oligopeptidase catalytic domain-containing protein n=1 Tax=Flavihumibacter solisilvae TaxID=1349421 RepID=A0A0C1IWL3_9BACT|nr:alpha/beta hydrolase-fold protein [Flavihumibacter solisilvae]KIC94889.1 hypothetical protein OI18_08230 [Flavihumibacter solisilvae]
MKRVIIAGLLLAGCINGFAQKSHVFTEGLYVGNVSHYGREAVYSDVLAYRLYTNSMATPAGGQVFDTVKGKPVSWQLIKADSLNRMRGSRGFGGGGGYFYLTYTSGKQQVALLKMAGNSAVYVNGELHTGDPYGSGWLYIPVTLKKGLNEFYARAGFLTASLEFPAKPVHLNIQDPTMPFIVAGLNNNELMGAVVVTNTTSKKLSGLEIATSLNNNKLRSSIPEIPAMSSRKVIFRFNGQDISAKGKYACDLQLLQSGKALDDTSIQVEAVDANESYSRTFISNIDGSLQYYAVTPTSGKPDNAALFLSVHGAGVEAIGQARAYKPKDWGNLIAATNRRPRGFNWEDWGRLDALEVLNIGLNQFKPDPRKIYLTGHSMGGHGTWFLGATYPDKWAAIAPCAGYPTLKGYGSADGLVPDNSSVPIEQMLLRSSNQSDVPRLAENYKQLGVYIFHGDSDRVVSVNYARQMRAQLGGFHSDMSYYEYPGGSHWFGDHSVDWKPIFDFFQWHQSKADSAVNEIDFQTASPGISPAYRWASILQQDLPLQYSRIKLNRNKTAGTITGSATNARLLKFSLEDFGANKSIRITLDSQQAITYTTKQNDSIFLVKADGKWTIATAPTASEKNPARYGTLKDAFNHRMVFVYGTTGNREENEWSFNKARFDAETWYYRGNGAVDIISDKEFSPEKYKDRGVIIFGNKSTNSAWKSLLSDCPIQVDRNQVIAGGTTMNGDDLSAYFVWPNSRSAVASVGVVTGTGIKGMKAANANQYFAGASGFPDFMIHDLRMLQKGVEGVKMAGFFDHNWKLVPSTEMVIVP